MSHRVVKGLKWARFSAEGPGWPKARPRGAKAAGLRYERELVKQFKGAQAGKWIEFEDQNGRGFAQPDLFFILRGEVVCLEAKLRWVPEGHSQGELLYKPLLEEIFRLPCRVVVVCKVLTPWVPRERVFSRLADALRGGQSSSPVLHWIGTGGI